MPHRLLILAIVLFWLATTAWLFYRDLRPLFLSGEPPPFSIDLADEVSSQKERGDIYWNVFQDGLDKGYAKTGTRYFSADDTYELYGIYHFFSKGHGKQNEPDQVIESDYRVTPEGELRKVNATVSVAVIGMKVEAEIHGQVLDQLLTSHIKITSRWADLERDLDPVPVPTRGSVLNPMQPLNRLTGLHKGQHWRQPLIDPLADAMRGMAKKMDLPPAVTDKGPDVRFLDALVLPDPQVLEWGLDHTPISCLVIDYHAAGEDTHAQTWVSETDGQVFQQEVTQNGQTLTLVRLDPRAPVDDRTLRGY